MGGECAQLADDDLHKNAIGLFNTADYSEPWFVPHKDISLPHHPSRGENSLSIRGRKVREGSMERTILAFFAGNLKRYCLNIALNAVLPLIFVIIFFSNLLSQKWPFEYNISVSRKMILTRAC